MAESEIDLRIRELRELCEEDPADSLAWFMLGGDLEKADLAAEAADAFRRAVEANPDYTAAWRGLGRALAAIGSDEEAKAAFEHGIEVAERTGDLQTGKEMRVFLKRLGGGE